MRIQRPSTFCSAMCLWRRGCFAVGTFAAERFILRLAMYPSAYAVQVACNQDSRSRRINIEEQKE